MFIEGWDDEDIIDTGNYIESDSDSYNAFLEEPISRRLRPSIADTTATVALRLWSTKSAAEKKSQIATALKSDHEKTTFHRLPSALNLTR